MRRAFASERLKLRTTRTFYALVASAVLATVALSALAAALGSWKPTDTAPGEDLVGLAFFGEAFALVLGLLAITTEFRHGTITPTLLAVPERSRLVVGVGVGALVRNQVGALVGGLAWLFVVEPLLAAIPTVGDAVARFGLGGLLDGLDGSAGEGGTDLLGQLPAGLLLAAYVALAAALAVALLRRRDVTA